MGAQLPDEPIFNGDPEDKITHRACGKQEAFMPQVAGNLFYWYCAVCKEWFVPARTSTLANPVQCREADGKTMADVMRAALEPLARYLTPIGVEPSEAFYVIRKDSAENLWRLVNTPAGARHFDTKDSALAAARAAADSRDCPEVLVLRCAQEVIFKIMKGDRA